MPPSSAIRDADRIVAYLPAAVETLRELNNQEYGGITKTVETFLSDPEGTFHKHPRENLGHVRDLQNDLRSFATWCQNQSLQSELCVVHMIYRKENENQYWPELDGLGSQGDYFYGTFEGLSPEDYSDWRDGVATRENTRIVE